MIDDANNSATPLCPHDHVIFTDLDGVEGVLVDLDSKQYYQLNETASLIWRGLAKRRPVVEIAREMTALYLVTLEHAQSSIEAALGELVAHRLVKTSHRST